MVAHHRKVVSRFSTTENGVPCAMTYGIMQPPGIQINIARNYKEKKDNARVSINAANYM